MLRENGHYAGMVCIRWNITKNELFSYFSLDFFYDRIILQLNIHCNIAAQPSTFNCRLSSCSA
jgi:hypothetical protein